MSRIQPVNRDSAPSATVELLAGVQKKMGVVPKITDGEIAEIVANVALNIFTNYFNHVAGTEVDFPVAPELAAA